MNKYIYRFIFICLAGISCLCSCSEKEDVGLGAYCGSYAAESVSWTGLPVDVNGDGVMSRDMLKEFYGQPGFVPGWIGADVQLCADGKSLSYNCVVPAVVVIETAENQYYHTVQYHGVEIISTWHPDWGTPSFTSGAYVSVLDDNMRGIEKADLHDITETAFDLHVDCVLFDPVENNIVDGTAVFKFRKQ